MATDIEQLIVSLEARTKTFENALNRSNSLAARNAKAIESRFAALNKNVSGQLDGLASIGVKAFALIGGAAGGKELIDSSIKISNALKVTGLSGQQLTDVYDKLFASAQQNNTPLETLVTLYSRASMASKELHASQSDLLNFSDKVALALRVQGSSAEESAGALLQLSQALGNGTVQAEEYNSLLDGGRSILQATAAGLKEAGGSVSELTKLVKSGKVSSEAFFRAFLAGAPVLAQQVASSETTISGSFVRLQNVLVDAAGKFNKSGEASKTFAAFVDEAAGTINAINFDALFGQIDKLYNKWISLQNAISNSGQNFGEATGLNNVGKWIAGAINGDQTAADPGTGKLFYSTKAVTDRINDAFSNAGQSQDNAALTADAIRASLTGKTAIAASKAGPRLPADPNAGKKEDKVKPVTLADYPVTGQKKGGGGGGSSEDEYQRESRKIQEHTDLLKAQTAAQEKLNPLVKDFGYPSPPATNLAYAAGDYQGRTIDTRVRVFDDDDGTYFSDPLHTVVGVDNAACAQPTVVSVHLEPGISGSGAQPATIDITLTASEVRAAAIRFQRNIGAGFVTLSQVNVRPGQQVHFADSSGASGTWRFQTITSDGTPGAAKDYDIVINHSGS